MSKRLSDTIYDGIRSDIEIGVLKSKTFISESEVAQRYNVSKAPVKIALQKLCQEAFLIGYPRKGYMVNTMTDEEFEQLKLVRAHYEQLSVVLAIANASDDEIMSLKAPHPEGNPNQIHNAHFHCRLAEIGHNPYHLDAVSRLIRFQVPIKITNRKVSKSHDKIVEALLSRDQSMALEMIREDLFMDIHNEG